MNERLGLINKEKIVDYYAMFYILLNVILSQYVLQFNLIYFMLFLFLALPFINKPEHFICIAILLSTISYYFLGASPDIISIYTIMLFILCANILLIQHGRIMRYGKNIGFIVLLVIVGIISYMFSPFEYTNGIYRLIYIAVVTIILGNVYKIKFDVFFDVLPKLSMTMVIGIIITVFLNSSLQDGRISIADTVNANTFGMACAQLSTILFLSFFLSQKKKLIHIVLGISISVLAFLSGSRGALFAFIIAFVFVIVLRSKRLGQLSGMVFKLSVIGIICLFIMSEASTLIGLDMARFRLSTIIESGGTNRVTIYIKLIPYIISHGYWTFGYGPGNECSRIIVSSLVGRNYSHTHNTFLEAFGELGIGGLIILLILVISTFIYIWRGTKKYDFEYIILGMFICLLMNGMAEAYFNHILLWILFAIGRQCNIFDIEQDDGYIGEK